MSASASILARKLPRDSSLPPSDPPAFRLLSGLTVLVGLASLATAFALDGHAVSAPGWRFIPWIGVVVGADLASIRVGKGLQLSFGYPVLLLAAFVYSPGAAGIVALVGSTDLRELRGEISLLHALFNRAQVALCVMGASVVFGLAGGRSDLWPVVFLPALAALITDMGINSLWIALGARLKHGATWRQLKEWVMVGGVIYFLVTFGLYGLSAVLLREFFLRYGLWAFVAFVIPVVLGHEVFAHALTVKDKSEELELRTAALETVSQRIADERRDERTRVAAGLHDDVLQPLHHVHLMGEVLRHDLASGRLLDLEHDLPELLYATETAANSIRTLVRDLRNSSIGPGGLTPTTQLLVDDLSSRTRIPIRADLADVGGSPQIQLLVYQVAREALQNAVKHSDARSIEVRLFREGPQIQLVVQDDGRGFDPDDVDTSSHFGLELIRERLDMAGGDVGIESRPGHGTRISARFPQEVSY